MKYNAYQNYYPIFRGIVDTHNQKGQVINFNSLSNDVGVSGTTLKEWFSVLKAYFIIVKLEPYYEDFGKRVIKSAKIYFIDTSLLAYLLDIESAKILKRDPLIGNIFENLPDIN